MQKAVRATFFHIASSKENNNHCAYCPEGSNSWWGMQRDQANGTCNFIHSPGLPHSVIEHVKPIVEQLSDKSLLEKSLHGRTQNHESFNGTVWNRVPKTTYAIPNWCF